MNNGLQRNRVVGPAFAAGVLFALVSMPVLAEVYVHTGEHGEVSFTDQAVPGAERVTLDPAEPPPKGPEELEHRIRQTLEVAEALEESRLAREQARAEARAAARAAQPEPAPQVIYQDRYVYPYGFGAPFDHRFGTRDRFHHRDRFRHHDRFDSSGHGDHHRNHRSAGQRTISKPFLYDPD